MTNTLIHLKTDLEALSRKAEELDSLIANDPKSELSKYALEEKNEIVKQIEQLQKSIESLSQTDWTQSLKGGAEAEINPNSAILEVRAGTGGDEAGLFASDLYNMYSGFGQKRGWKILELSRTSGAQREIRNVTAEIKGNGVYNLLKNESGVHRVQRVPITESAGRIHTSTATVAILPEVTPVQVEIDPKDVKLEFFHASGHGGQNVNKVQTAVRVQHLPTGVIVESQEQRNQAQNREKAMQILRSRLFEMMKEQQKSKVDELRSDQIGLADRSEKIRTYNFPQDRITDHRLKQSFHNIPAILGGELDEIVEASSKL